MMILACLLAFQLCFMAIIGFEIRLDVVRSVGGRRRCFHQPTMKSSEEVCSSTKMASMDDSEVHVPLIIHHTAFKTRNITLAVDFYGLFGFEVAKKFWAGPARAAWLEQNGSSSSRIELIEVPSYMLNEPEGMKRRALDLQQKQELLGLNHLAIDVTNSIKAQGLSNLTDWLQILNEKSTKTFGKTMRVALEPREQLIGNGIFEIAFLYDADGALVELLNKQSDLPQSIDSGWEPLDTNFEFEQ